MSIKLTFGDWLRQRRAELGVSQEDFSEHLGFSTSMLRKLESGERRPSGQIAYILADYLRIPADEREAFVAFARIGQAGFTDAGGAVTAYDSAPDDVTPLAPWRRVYVRRTNLPSMLTPLIGREREEAEAHDLLLHPRTRLLTLTGTPGVGKTRLGLQVAANMVEHFDGGVFFVDLAPIIDADLVMTTIARTLGLEAGNRAIESVLMDYVRERRMLLFLDNFEQVLDAGSALVKLLEASRWLKALVTSREVLHVRGERRFPVMPLTLPDLRQLPPLETLSGYPAIELFVERTLSVDSDFALTDQNAADVAAVCAGLEGLPLAIELAAARANHFTLREMRSALGSRLKILTGGARDLPARHRTLRKAIEWSYELLDESEQRLFRRLGVFVGRFESEAADALEERQPDSSPPTLDTLLSLTDKNLVRKERQTARPGGVAPPMRFGLLEAIREYAIEQMEKHGEIEEARRRHADYYLSLAERSDKHFFGAKHPGWGTEGVAWINRLETDLDNMRVALGWYEEQAEKRPGTNALRGLKDLEKGLRLATGLKRVWFVRGHFTEGLQRLTALLSKVPRAVPSEQPHFRATYAAALILLGRLALVQGDTVSVPVRAYLEESLGMARELGDKRRIAFTLLNLGAVAAAQGDTISARLYGGECLKLYRKLGDMWGVAAALQDLGDIESRENNLGIARSLLEESLACYREVGESFGVASILGSLGNMAYYQGDYSTAGALWEESLQLRKEIGDKSRVCHSLVLLGWTALRESKYDKSRVLFTQGLLLARDLGAVLTIYWSLVGLAALEGAEHRTERAVLLFGATLSLREARSIQPPPAWQAELDAEVASAQALLHGEAWNNAWAEGYAMTFEAAITFALAIQ